MASYLTELPPRPLLERKLALAIAHARRQMSVAPGKRKTLGNGEGTG